LVGGCGSALGLRAGQVIVKLFFARRQVGSGGVERAHLEVYLPGFRSLYVFGERQAENDPFGVVTRAHRKPVAVPIALKLNSA
jgi:hypothetical protein